jgi:hypothetical protein
MERCRKYRVETAPKVQAQTTIPQYSRPFPKPQPIQAKADEQELDQHNQQRFSHNILTALNNSSAAPQPAATGMPIMPKLTAGAVGDKYEQEADAVASQVVQQLNSPPDRMQRYGYGKKDEATFQRQPIAGAVQRVPGYGSDAEEETVRMKPMVQLKGASVGGVAPPDLEEAIQRERSRGQALADNIRNPMENAFGADFGGVRIHTDNTADQLNQSIQAKAFTTEQDVFFRQGAYAPQSKGGQELLAHELTHVVQQNGRSVQRSLLQRNVPNLIQRDDDESFSESTGNAIDICSSGADIVKGLSDTAGITSLAGNADALGDFTGDVATTLENSKFVYEAYKVGIPRTQEETLTTIQGVAGLAALTSSLDTYGTLLSYVTDTSSLISLGSYISEYNPIIGFIGSGTKTLRATQEGWALGYIRVDMDKIASDSSKPDSVKQTAQKLSAIAWEQGKGKYFDAGLNAADTLSNAGDPLSKGITQVATKSMGSSWGGWMVRKLAQSNRFTASYIDSYETAKQRAEQEAEQSKESLRLLALPTVNDGETEDVKKLYLAAKALKLDYFMDAIKTAVLGLPDGDKKTQLGSL